MSDVCVFTGPTIPPAVVNAILDATCLPPVSQGDVYIAARKKPKAIGIIDGYFDHMPAVWHKEILWALSQGIMVFGSASMGALRAAELSRFGMRGVGWIFNAFLSGELEDDDEVAMMHSSLQLEGKYVSFSEPMVNIRRTLNKAAAEGIVTTKVANEIVAHAKKLFYGERTYESILALAAANSPESETSLRELMLWLRAHRVDQKRLDAIEMLEVIRDSLASPTPPPSVEFHFESTELWRHFTTRVQLDRISFPVKTDDGAGNTPIPVRVHDRALLRWSFLEIAKLQAVEPDESALRDTILQFRTERGLLEQEHVERWLRERGMTLREFVALMEEEARCRLIRNLAAKGYKKTMLDMSKLGAL